MTGTLQSAAATDTERDVNDPFTACSGNDNGAAAPPVRSIGTIGGYASAVGAGVSGARFASQADVWDIFRTYLVAGQHVSLLVGAHDAAAPADVELDLRLYAVSNQATPAQASETINATEALTVAVSGEYFIAVLGYAGASPYVLTLDRASAVTAKKATKRKAVPRQHVVVFESAARAASATRALGDSDLGGRHWRVLPQGGPMMLVEADQPLGENALKHELDATRSLPPAEMQRMALVEAMKLLAMLPGVHTVEPNGWLQPSAAPTDQYYRLQWHSSAINWSYAADVTLGAGSVVAVVDTGVSPHPDLVANLRTDWYDFVFDPVKARDGNGPDADPSDPGDGEGFPGGSFHGAHVGR